MIEAEEKATERAFFDGYAAALEFCHKTAKEFERRYKENPVKYGVIGASWDFQIAIEKEMGFCEQCRPLPIDKPGRLGA